VIVDSQCLNCAHLLLPVTNHVLRCVAFSTEIPDVIFRNGHDHRLAYPEDNGIGWEPAAEEDADFWDRLSEGGERTVS